MSGIQVVNNGKKIILDRTFNETPTRKSPTLFKVGTGTTTPTITDTDLETPVSIDGGNTKAFQTGFPSINYSTLNVTIRCFLGLTEANGNNLTEFGTFNNDATKLMFSRATNTSISKTDAVQVVYIEKHLFT